MLTTFLTPILLQMSSPAQPVVQGKELLSENYWSCCSLTPRNQGWGRTRGKDRSYGAAQALCTGGGAQLSIGLHGQVCGDRAAGLCVAPQKPRQEGIPACGRLVMCWLCAGGTRSSLCMYADKDPLVTLSHVLNATPLKKPSSIPEQIKEAMVCLRICRLASALL